MSTRPGPAAAHAPPHRPTPARALKPWLPSAAMGLVLMLLVSLQFGPLIGLLGYRLTGHQLWAVTGGVRDILVLALLGLAVAHRLSAWHAGRADVAAATRWVLGMAVVYTTMAVLLSDSALLIQLLNLRRLLLVPLLTVALLWIPWTPAQIDRLMQAIVASAGLVAALGLIEWFAPPSLWTDTLQIEAFTAANGYDRYGSATFEHNGRFFSGELSPWVGQPVRRMIASYLEPTTLAAGMATLLALALARRARGHAATGLIALAVAAGLATLSKGFWLFLAVLAMWRAMGVPAPHMVWRLTALCCTVAWLLANQGDQGALIHVAGLGTALQHLASGAWLGEGIGAAGNYSNTEFDAGGESGLGNLIVQAGVAAVLPLAWVAALSKAVLATGVARRDPGAPWLAAWLLFWLLTFVYSASSQGVSGNALGFAAIALYLHPASAPHRLARLRRSAA